MDTSVRAPLSDRATVSGRRSFYARVSALGFGLVALAGLIIVVLGLVSGSGGEGAVFGIVFIVVGLLIAGLAWGIGRGALIAAAILSLALLGLVGPFSTFSLGHPESARDFVPIVLMLVGALLGLVGSVVGIVQWRRKTARPNATSTERLVLGVTLGVVTGVILLSVILTLTGRTLVSAEARAGATSVDIKNFAFAPGTLQAKAGDTVRLVVRNDDQTLHTFTLPQAGVDVSVAPGTEKVVEFKAPASGAYQWYCIPHSQANGSTREGMVGSLQVQ